MAHALQKTLFSEAKTINDNIILSYKESLAIEADIAHTANTLAILPYIVIKFTGKNVAGFLQGQFGCNLDLLTSNSSLFGCYCNVKGRVLAVFRIFIYNNEVYLRIHNSLCDAFITELSKYAKFSRIKLEVTNMLCFGLNLVHATNMSLPNRILETTTTDSYVINKINNNRYEIYVEPDNFDQGHFEDKATIVGYGVWLLFDISDGIPDITTATREKCFPHAINLPKLGAVHFDKGCYRGQEVIARMEYRGKTNRHLYKAIIESDKVIAGDEILADATAGLVINATVNAAGNTVALLELHNKYADKTLSTKDGSKITDLHQAT